MKYTRSIIEKNLTIYPDAEYYFKLLDIIKENLDKHPDVVIDSCKALVEGVCRFVLFYNNDSETKTSVENYDFTELFTKSMERLSEVSDKELDFVNGYKKLIEKVRKLRNERGDVSHGKIAPKEFYSSKDFAIMLASFTDGVVYYILSVYFNIDFSVFKEMEYSDNEEFNQYLDENNDNILGNRYSEALFKLDKKQYEADLDTYIYN